VRKKARPEDSCATNNDRGGDTFKGPRRPTKTEAGILKSNATFPRPPQCEEKIFRCRQICRADPQPVWAADPIRQPWEPESCRRTHLCSSNRSVSRADRN
jgi:hypothetical protein